MQMGRLWKWIGEEESRTMVVDECISLSELHDKVYEKLQINKEEFRLKFSYCLIYRQRKWASYLNNDDDNDVETFLLGRTGKTIETTLQVSKEPRVVINSNVGVTVNLSTTYNLSKMMRMKRKRKKMRMKRSKDEDKDEDNVEDEDADL